ncbi:MAG TPA: hypothetical protein VL285_06070 [Bryobacteraceae bacterium]|jgi:hypothetical protein|nr:hypothetical protein [Bryobacteraceae bacterium]
METEAQLTREFEACALPASGFHHREHVRVAWYYLRQLTYQEAVRRMLLSVRTFADFNGAASKYHHTLTVAWMRLVAAALASRPSDGGFEQFADAHPGLLDPATIGLYFSPERLREEAARSGWMAPDIRPLP